MTVSGPLSSDSVYVTVADSMYTSSKFPPATVGGGSSTQVSGAIIGAVVAAVVVLVVGSVVIAASLIVWKVRSTKASTGMHCTVVFVRYRSNAKPIISIDSLR